jgi:protein-S-isoprenylcysteine O-methyltransferase Ste14
MPKLKPEQLMYELSAPSYPQRLTLAILLAGCLALAWWLLLGAGVGLVASWFGWAHAGNQLRLIMLAVALSIYFIRVLFTEFVFLKRGVSWSEVFTIAPWVLFIYVLLSLAAAGNTALPGPGWGAGCALFVLGSWLNSYAEYARHKWKQQPGHRGKLYTLGLFRLTRHPNYLGDLISFSGLCLLSGRWMTVIIPVLMLAGFVFVNIPALDAHLRSHYGAEFDDYARRTRRLIPFLY